MANTAISGLTAATSVTAADTTVLVQGGVTKKATLDLLPVSTPTQAALNLKAALASPIFTGTPTAPTPADGTATTQVATTAFVASAITVLTTGAPSSLNTFGEVAGALGGDANFASTTSTALGGKVGSDGSVLQVIKLTQTAYDALATKAATTLYIIVGS